MKPDNRTIAERLQACSDDLMLADHAEVPKSWCEEASLEIRRLRLIADAVLHAAESYPFCPIAHWAEHGPVATLLAELRGRSDGASSACDTDPVERQLEATLDVEPFFGDIVAGNACLAAKQARPLADWHEEVGVVLWWRFPVEEPPYCGSPHYDDWPDYHTHWTPLIVPYDPE
jgi:hypothetical protein